MNPICVPTWLLAMTNSGHWRNRSEFTLCPADCEFRSLEILHLQRKAALTGRAAAS